MVSFSVLMSNAALLQHTVAVPIEIDVVLIGFNGDGGFAYTMDSAQLESLLYETYPIRTPISRETKLPMTSEYHIMYNVILGSEVGNEHQIRTCCCRNQR